MIEVCLVNHVGSATTYEHVIRNDEEWNRVREYIAGNPTQWEMDPENPNHHPMTTLTEAEAQVAAGNRRGGSRTAPSED